MSSSIANVAATARKRIVFTGGAGKAGRHVIPELVRRGHRILNLDLVPLNHPGVFDLKTDLTDLGQVFNAFSTHFNMEGYLEPSLPGKPDAIIHFAAIARNMLIPDNECFRQNVMATYNVIEAACKLGVKKIIIASSETTYGVCFAQGDADYHSFPLEEDYDCDPMDSYANSKVSLAQASDDLLRTSRNLLDANHRQALRRADGTDFR